MEVMEEGNVLDRVRILLQRDLDYYNTHQTVLQENLCSAVVGGLLDFPRYASFASVKLVMWWEDQFTGTFRRPSGLSGSNFCEDAERGCGGIVANIPPGEFIRIIKETASQLLDHLHILSQEALDHADLTVLTGTLGAAALIKNCLWCYNEQLSKEKNTLTLHDVYKKYHEMSEALAERLLDLHCRLLSLYILQDADSLCWDHPQSFFEGERGSFVIQMWWLYMKGTRKDLWSTVPPKTAQRVLSGMLNESLTILTNRYVQAVPNNGRANLIITDIGNLLMCVNELLPSICADAGELVGVGGSKEIRDIHSKCHQLLTCLILRGAPLATLHKIFRNGFEGATIFEDCTTVFAPWISVVAPDFKLALCGRLDQLPEGHDILLHLKVLTAQPQPSYPLLVKVLIMRDYKVSTILLKKILSTLGKKERKPESKESCCRFLCSKGGDCSKISGDPHTATHALIFVISSICSIEDFGRLVIPALESVNPNWAHCLDRHQVWNTNRPCWLTALLCHIEELISPLVTTILRALELENTTQLVALTLTGLVRSADILPPQVFKMASVLQEFIPADVKPLGKSVLLQMLVSVVYALLIKTGNDKAIALGEALCHLRAPPAVVEHLEDIGDMFLDYTEPGLEGDVAISGILFSESGRHSLRVLNHVIIEKETWLINHLLPTKWNYKETDHLLQIMFRIGPHTFDEILSGVWKPDYQSLLEMPLSLSRNTVWHHISRRPEFKNPQLASKHDKVVIDNLNSLFHVKTF